MSSSEEKKSEESRFSSLIDSIPVEVWGEVISYFTPPDLLNFSLVSREYNKIVQKNVYVEFEAKSPTRGAIKVQLFYFNGKYFLPLHYRNYGEYKKPRRGGWSPNDSDMTTEWYKIRIDPKTWKVHSGDYTFSKTTGWISHNKGQTGCPWGTCFDCEAPRSHSAKAILDLRDTPFYLDTKFHHQGCSSNGTWKFSHKNQRCDLTGGGHCGWTCPDTAPYNGSKLEFLGDDGKNPQLACGTESGKVFLHDPNSSEEPIRFLSINRDVQSITSGKFDVGSSIDHLFVGTENTLLCYDVEKNSDMFFLDVADGLSSMYFTENFCDRPVIMVGGNCTISGYDSEGNEHYWNSTGGNVTCMVVDPLTKILYVGADDYNIYVYREEEMLKEFTESNVVTHLCCVGNGLVGYALADNSFGVYNQEGRIWRKKIKFKITALLAFDLTVDGKRELVVGNERGYLEVRGQRKGKRVYREKLRSPISKILKADYKQNGKELLIVCCENGVVKGFLAEQVQRYLQSVNNFDEEIERLKQRKQDMLQEIDGYLKNISALKGGRQDPSLIDHTTAVKCRLRPNMEKRAVDIVFQSTKSTTIKLAVIKAENLFPEGETTKLYYSAKPSDVLDLPLKPEKDLQIQISAMVLVGHSQGEWFHVFELTYKMPKFSMYIPVRFFETEPQGYVKFKLPERIPRIAMWFNTSFNIVYKHDSKETLNVKFVSLRSQKPLQLLFRNSEFTIKVDDMNIAGEMVQDLCHQLNIKQLYSEAHFPAEFSKIVESLQTIVECTKIKNLFSTEMAEVSQNLKALIISAENNRLLMDIDNMRSNYSRIMDLNRDLIGEYKKRETNQSRLNEAVKFVNQAVASCGKLRVGDGKKKVVTAIRSLIQKRNYEALPKIMQFGGSPD